VDQRQVHGNEREREPPPKRHEQNDRADAGGVVGEDGERADHHAARGDLTRPDALGEHDFVEGGGVFEVADAGRRAGSLHHAGA
jgi:hypothetical protein